MENAMSMRLITFLATLLIFAAGCALNRAAQSAECRVELKSHKFEEDKLQLSVYSSCELLTYPYVVIKAKNTREILAQGRINSFGQPADTIDSYEVGLQGKTFSLKNVELIMVSDMDKRRNVVLK